MKTKYYLVDHSGELYNESYSKEHLEDIRNWYRSKMKPEAFVYLGLEITTQKPEAVE